MMALGRYIQVAFLAALLLCVAGQSTWAMWEIVLVYVLWGVVRGVLGGIATLGAPFIIRQGDRSWVGANILYGDDKGISFRKPDGEVVTVTGPYSMETTKLKNIPQRVGGWLRGS